ncbi:ArsR/SmtB family transcription factor [Actinacidiphila oryziradicis]|uniref:Winged helix-turn-helix transcriptional regulator n=1 Tax=Actinacidiphila oryziradicis TaxID=2571141 RepID=A0A4U0SLZ9_9ACTN|nr:metalloregulator ArsR/SmtB family transcription factor [Actinacidiphila oryziradicis]TKA09201.1 winged helix-turn-helix transcriptional regulator [Actinacidiphila oryziradicis]
MPVADVIEVLADPNRRRILDLLRDGERPVGDLVDHLGITQPSVSKHLRVLRDAGLVEVRRDAQRRLYRIRPQPLAELDAWLEPYRKLWSASLGRLERHLDERTRQ